MKVRFSSEARADLRAIGEFIAEDSPSRALTFIDELEARCHSIGSAPAAGPDRSDLVVGLRMIVFRRYLVFYTVEATGVRVVRIVHGARNLSRIF
jgi:toxin ParE1/3/4